MVLRYIPTWLLAVAYLLNSVQKVNAQPNSFFHLTSAVGLSDNFVSSLAIDRKGFLWIGTSEGLNVFDGYSITSYLKKYEPQMAANNIRHLTCDSRNRIWMGTPEGISWVDEKRKFHRVVIQDTTSKFAARTILDTKKYGPVIYTSLGQFFLNESIGKWEKLEFIPQQLEYRQFMDAEPFTENQFLFGTVNSIILFDYSIGKIVFEMPLKGIVSLCRYSDREIAVATEYDGVMIVDINQKKITKRFLLDRELNHKREKTMLNEVRPGINKNLLVASDHAGLIVIDSTGNVNWYYHNPIDINSIGSNFSRRVICSDRGDVIVGSTIAGLSCFDLFNRRAGYKTMFHDGHGVFFDSYIADITEDRAGNIWMGAFEKLIRWNRENDQTKFYSFYGETESFGYEIRSICTDSLDRIWAGTLNNGLHLLNEKNGKFFKIPLDTNIGIALKDPNILELKTASNGIIWASTRDGIFTIDPKTFNIDAFRDHPQLKELSGVRVDYILEDKKHRMWFATYWDGVFCYDKSNRQLIHYTKENGLPAGRCFALYQDQKENIYVGVVNGFAIISPNGNIRVYGPKDGIKYERCDAILEDEKGKIWIGNVKCLIRFDPQTEAMELFDQNVGLTAEQFRPGSFYKSRRGELLWGSRRGINYFFQDQLANKPKDLKVNIVSATVGDSLVYLNESDGLKVKYSKNSILFRFTAIDLQGSHNIHYRFKLEGHDEQWQEGIDIREARYSILSPGNYTFMVQASADGANWISSNLQVPVKVIPPVWKQTWFIILFVVVFFSVMFFTLRSRNQQLKRKQEELETQQAISYFISSMSVQDTESEILWDLARNCVDKLHIQDCVIFIKDEDRNVLVQKAWAGDERPEGFDSSKALQIKAGDGIVGTVLVTGVAEIIPDTTKDPRYIMDLENHLSEISIPIKYDGEVLGVLDCEHSKKSFFTQKHLSILTTIASLCANRIVRARAEKEKREAKSILMDTQRKMTEVEMQALRAQMNPHFIFNCLNSINRYIVKSDQTTASLYLTKFAKLIRLILDNSNNKNVILTNELEALKLYIEMEALRFDKKFTYEVKVDGHVSTDSIEVPPLIIQPYVENAIWHGLLHKETGGHLSIRVSLKDDTLLTCVIEDNGIGREKAKELRSKTATSRKSLGMQLTENRLSLLNKHAELNASVEIVDMSNGHGESAGTKVILKIPV